jgi:hypothetical protein
VLILELDILRAYDASVDIGYQTLRLAEEEVSLWTPGEGPRPSSLVVAKDHVIPTQFEGIVIARTQKTLGVEKGLVEPSPIHFRQEVPVRVLNATHRVQTLMRGSSLAHCEPVTLVTPP